MMQNNNNAQLTNQCSLSSNRYVYSNVCDSNIKTLNTAH